MARTLKEIAAELGVSHTLVSCVASGKMGNTRISETTRQTIEAHLRKIGFQPNRLALALKGGHKGYVAIFLHKLGTPGSEMNEQFISAVSDSLAEHSLGMWLRFFTSSQEFLEACSRSLLQEVDGLIVAGIAHPDLLDCLRDLQSKGLPVVCAFPQWAENHEVPNVGVDADLQGYLAGKHLLELGCRRIARFNSHAARHEGFLRALEEAGVQPIPELICAAEDFGYEGGVRCMERLVQAGLHFDGLTADSDAQASGAAHYLLRTGFPRESWPYIVGTDDSPMAKHCAIPLTSVTSEISERARHAVKLLFDRMKNLPAPSVELTPHLVVRESTVAREVHPSGDS